MAGRAGLSLSRIQPWESEVSSGPPPEEFLGGRGWGGGRPGALGLLRDLFPVLRRMTMCSGARLALLVYGILMHSSVYGSPAASGLRFPGIR